ncbi:MAG: galactokinase [Roseiflexaceae bacterium]
MPWRNMTVLAPNIDVHAVQDTLSTTFDPAAPVWVARAPGRLDVMGGIADYSGSLVLQLPLALAAVAYVQLRTDGRVLIESRADASVLGNQRAAYATRDVCELGVSIAAVRAVVQADPATAWAGYIVGALTILVHQTGVNLSGGVTIVVDSDVPLGKGVSSSAAIEVATMRALAAACGRDIEATTLALWCQMVENLVVGAPCGVMDQMTSASGVADTLLALRCQPAQVLPGISLPPDVRVWGIDSGVRHSVGGADYGSVRVGAFMGMRILEAYAQQLQIPHAHWNGYLANITPSEYTEYFSNALPETITGADFTTRYGTHGDAVTTIDPTRVYQVRSSATHPIAEHHRVQLFAQLVHGYQDVTSATLLGELMYQSHQSYTECGLGSDATDAIVAAVRRHGPRSGLYGAKITGGGSGGTVAILASASAADTVHEIASQCGSGLVIQGSSDGAARSPVTRWESFGR